MIKHFTDEGTTRMNTKAYEDRQADAVLEDMDRTRFVVHCVCVWDDGTVTTSPRGLCYSTRDECAEHAAAMAAGMHGSVFGGGYVTFYVTEVAPIPF